MQQSKKWIVGRLLALAMLTGGGGAFYAQHQGEVARAEVQAAAADPYVQAVARDASTSDAVKIAMLMGHLYESSGKHVGTPYIDKLGRGQPLTVCNGITGAGVVAGKWYTPADCYELEKGRYLQAERAAKRLFAYWASYDAITQATFLDFIHNKGEGALGTSTMLRKANAGDVQGACRENPKWNKGTVKGVLTVLPGLKDRADTNAGFCLDGGWNE
ncbi:lysozyme [Comamonas aquatica]|uniref:lysozyme n=1 Tax=Comamonas aquatica TaxID=225991 RepID=UPI00244D57C6|nr:glycoside hydrolase family protein [Comamonas aquatica]MDH1673923.1 glycoside hydrolase family protein [Comamonas aquatica]MDH1677215.1 glycoside hydrolase family protein [Comamonas aquatica]